MVSEKTRYSQLSFAVFIYLLLANGASFLLDKVNPAFFNSDIGSEIRFIAPLLVSGLFIFLIINKIMPTNPCSVNATKKDLGLLGYIKYFFILRGVALVSICINALLFPKLIQGIADYTSENTETISMELLIFGTVTAVILAPILEEILIRKLPFEKLGDPNKLRVITYTAIIFGLMHANILQTLNAFLLGIVLGIVLFKTGGVKATIILHVVYNLSLNITKYIDYFHLGKGMYFVFGTFISLVGVLVLVVSGIIAIKNKTIKLPSITDIKIILFNPGTILLICFTMFMIITSLLGWIL